jgi:hypothetical protein
MHRKPNQGVLFPYYHRTDLLLARNKRTRRICKPRSRVAYDAIDIVLQVVLTIPHDHIGCDGLGKLSLGEYAHRPQLDGTNASEVLAWGGQVKIVPLVERFSTTRLGRHVLYWSQHLSVSSSDVNEA